MTILDKNGCLFSIAYRKHLLETFVRNISTFPIHDVSIFAPTECIELLAELCLIRL